MMRSIASPQSIATLTKRCFSSSSMNRMHVAVLGAAGGIGQPVSATILSAKKEQGEQL